MASDVRLAIHNYFREFGHDVAEAVYQELQKPGGMVRLLKKLRLPVEGDAAQQYVALVQYFRRHGTSHFMELVGARPLNFQIDVVSSPTSRDNETRRRLGLSPVSRDQLKKPDDFTQETREEARPPQRKSEEETQTLKSPPSMNYKEPPEVREVSRDQKIKEETRQPIPASKEPPKSPAVEAAASPGDPQGGKSSPYEDVDENGFPKGPLIPAPSPDPEDVDKDDPSWDPDLPWDPTGMWPDVERRSGRERRRKRDRRKDVDIVYQNKRYGGDRRDEKERRRNWPRDGHRE